VGASAECGDCRSAFVAVNMNATLGEAGQEGLFGRLVLWAGVVETIGLGVECLIAGNGGGSVALNIGMVRGELLDGARHGLGFPGLVA
jgi:hypothetical protein